MDDSPYVMLGLDSNPETLVPMTAQHDREGNQNIWFFTSRNGPFGALGQTTAVFVSKDHDIFARFQGDLSEETDPGIFEKHWSSVVEAWFPGGRDDPNLLMMRMALVEATIWSTEELGLLGRAQMLLGMDVREKSESGHTTTRI